MSGITPCLWFDGNAEEAAKFYASLFPNSHVDAVHRAPSDYPSGKTGDVLLVEFTLMGQPFTGLNGGPQFQFNEAISFQIAVPAKVPSPNPQRPFAVSRRRAFGVLPKRYR
jgi:predicted 3-demethylubiquinone-9 3-methyltransferase (glyoxalase superfamily)